MMSIQVGSSVRSDRVSGPCCDRAHVMLVNFEIHHHMRITIPTIPLPSWSAAATAQRLKVLGPVDYQVAADRVATFLHPKGALVLTGAGVSVDSGIRAYRGSDGRYSNPDYK